MTPRRYCRLIAVLERRQPDLAVVMDGVHKAHNLSAVLRTCDAVGVTTIHAVAPPGATRAHHGISGGSARWVDVRRHDVIETAVAEAHGAGLQIVAAHQSERAVDFRRVDYTRPTAVLIGAELYGVSERAAELADVHAEIPMVGMVASLNVSVAAAVILYEAERQRAAAGQYERRQLDEATYERLLFEWGYPRLAARHRAAGRPYPRPGTPGFELPEAEGPAPRPSVPRHRGGR